MKFKAVYDEAAVPTRIRRKRNHDEVATVLAKFGDDKAWILDPELPNDPYTVSMEYWEPIPELTPSDALPGDLWSYGSWNGSARYRVLGVDAKARVWHIVADRGFDYKSGGDLAIQFENDNVTVYTRSLPDGIVGRTAWKLVERP